MNTRILIAILLLAFLPACQTAPPKPQPPLFTAPFIHPGILHSAADLAFIKSKVAAKEEPWYSAFQAMQKSPKASLTYTAHPLASINRGSKNTNNVGAADLLIDGGAAYTLALEYAITSDPAYAQKSSDILLAYASTVHEITGSDGPLVTGEAAVFYAASAEILRSTWPNHWSPDQQKQFDSLLRDRFYPIIKDFKPGNNGNWDAAMIDSMLAMGIYLDDHDMFNRALTQATTPISNGAIQCYFDEKGECQESGRDQGHAQMGLAFLGQACQVAWTQHVDLYADSDNRLLKGTEYIAKYNLGNDVPYTPYHSTIGKNFFPTISPKSRGRFSSIFEKIYHHYHDVEGLDMPFTKQVIDKMRPESEITNSFTPWGTLMFANLPND